MKKKEIKFSEIEIEKIKTISITSRKSKVNPDLFCKVHKTGSSFKKFLNSLPDVLAAKDFHHVLEKTTDAVHNKKAVILMCGAHIIKCGLSPVIIDLMKNGIITGIAINGAGAVHDTELAYYGQTSEDVKENLKNGTFGMVRETADIINTAISKGKSGVLGFGEVLGKRLCARDIRYKKYSIFKAGYFYRIPVTVHIAIGSDIIHQHPNADGEAIGKLSMRDFRIFAGSLKNLEGGVIFNIGSAVIMPEVFLKALTVARNLGYKIQNFTAVNMDMIQHYRPFVNVVDRPTAQGGTGIKITGHHEIMIPLLAAAIKENLNIK